MKGHRNPVPTDVIPDAVNHDRQPNWLVKRRLQSALATVTEGRTFTRTSAIPLTEGLRFDIANSEQGRVEFQGISRRSFVYRSGERPLISRDLTLVSRGLRYDIYSGPIFTRDVAGEYVESGRLDDHFLPRLCSGSIHAVELVVYDRWKKTWIVPTWHSFGRNPDTVPVSELTADGIAARYARAATMRAELPSAPVGTEFRLATDEAINRITTLLTDQFSFIITTPIQPITTTERLLPIGDIDIIVEHILRAGVIIVDYCVSKVRKNASFSFSDLPKDSLRQIGDGYRASIRTHELVPMGQSTTTTSYLAVIVVLNEKNHPVESFICGVSA